MILQGQNIMRDDRKCLNGGIFHHEIDKENGVLKPSEPLEKNKNKFDQNEFIPLIFIDFLFLEESLLIQSNFTSNTTFRFLCMTAQNCQNWKFWDFPLV